MNLRRPPVLYMNMRGTGRTPMPRERYARRGAGARSDQPIVIGMTFPAHAFSANGINV